MAPGKETDVLEESTESGSNDTTSKAGSSTTSCPAILDPSEDSPLFKREKMRRPLKTYKAIMRSYNSTEIYENSDLSTNDGANGPEMGGSHSVCIDLFHRYKNLAVKFRNSKLIYFVQILLLFLPLSAIGMGIKYADKCPGSPHLTVLTVITGIISLLLIGQWVVIKCCAPEDMPCEGQQKCFLLIFFIFVSVLLELEIYLFCTLLPSYLPSSTRYCSQAFYDYTYYKFIAASGSIFLVALIYFPDSSRFASGITCSDPVYRTCYQGALEESE